jgi:hypothetical protein
VLAVAPPDPDSVHYRATRAPIDPRAVSEDFIFAPVFGDYFPAVFTFHMSPFIFGAELLPVTLPLREEIRQQLNPIGIV